MFPVPGFNGVEVDSVESLPPPIKSFLTWVSFLEASVAASDFASSLALLIAAWIAVVFAKSVLPSPDLSRTTKAPVPSVFVKLCKFVISVLIPLIWPSISSIQAETVFLPSPDVAIFVPNNAATVPGLLAVNAPLLPVVRYPVFLRAVVIAVKSFELVALY